MTSTDAKMVRKKIDNRIRTLVENGVQQHHRTFFVLVGDRGRDQVVNLHYMLSKAQVKARPSVLWCYKKELGFSRSVPLRSCAAGMWSALATLESMTGIAGRIDIVTIWSQRT